MDSVAPAIGPATAILPLLNGLGHLESLDARFGADHVLGGKCLIAATLDADGSIRHLNNNHSLTFGERDGSRSARVDALWSAMSGVRFDAASSEAILQEMWEKWVFIAAAAGITCLMRASIGDIVAAGATGLALGLFAECAGIAARHGFPPSEASTARSVGMLSAPGSLLTASMLRDMERAGRTEADHILGDLLRRGGPGDDTRLLRIACSHMKTYDARRAREAAQSG